MMNTSFLFVSFSVCVVYIMNIHKSLYIIVPVVTPGFFFLLSAVLFSFFCLCQFSV